VATAAWGAAATFVTAAAPSSWLLLPLLQLQLLWKLLLLLHPKLLR
jgi:hypothetical protein